MSNLEIILISYIVALQIGTVIILFIPRKYKVPIVIITFLFMPVVSIIIYIAQIKENIRRK